MTTTKKLLLGLIAVGMAAATPARAALVTTQGDLLLSFYTVNGSSVGANAYTINLGQGINFFDGSTASGIVVNINTDLVSAFGASWWDNSELKMALVGGFSSTANPTSPDAARTVYAGAKLATYNPGTSTPAKAASSLNHNTWATNVSGFSDLQNGKAANGAVASNSAIMDTASDVSDVTNYVPPVSGGYFGIGTDPTTSFAAGNIGSSQEAALDLWKADKAAFATPQWGGTFSIDNTGNVSYSAVPEPSTVTMLGLAAILGSGLLRRRSRQQR